MRDDSQTQTKWTRLPGHATQLAIRRYSAWLPRANDKCSARIVRHMLFASVMISNIDISRVSRAKINGIASRHKYGSLRLYAHGFALNNTCCCLRGESSTHKSDDPLPLAQNDPKLRWYVYMYNRKRRIR